MRDRKVSSFFKSIFLMLIICLPLQAFADDWDFEDDTEEPVKTKQFDDKNYYQVKLGGGVFNIDGGWYNAPFVSFGKRFELGDSAVEISAAWGEHDYSDDSKLKYYSLPKIIFLQFADPVAKSSFFYGGGLSWSGIRKGDTKFDGIFAEVTMGYEFKRNASICPIVHIDLAQPLMAQRHEGSHPGPAVLLGMSIGF
jgi:hypothetical protein